MLRLRTTATVTEAGTTTNTRAVAPTTFIAMGSREIGLGGTRVYLLTFVDHGESLRGEMVSGGRVGVRANLIMAYAERQERSLGSVEQLESPLRFPGFFVQFFPNIPLLLNSSLSVSVVCLF